MILSMRKCSIFILMIALTLDSFARQNTLLDSGWRFKSGEVPNAEKPDFNDTDWQTISIPHNWGWEDAQEGRDYYRGPGWYRRELNITPEIGKRYFLWFGAAGQDAARRRSLRPPEIGSRIAGVRAAP